MPAIRAGLVEGNKHTLRRLAEVRDELEADIEETSSELDAIDAGRSAAPGEYRNLLLEFESRSDAFELAMATTSFATVTWYIINSATPQWWSRSAVAALGTSECAPRGSGLVDTRVLGHLEPKGLVLFEDTAAYFRRPASPTDPNPITIPVDGLLWHSNLIGREFAPTVQIENPDEVSLGVHVLTRDASIIRSYGDRWRGAPIADVAVFGVASRIDAHVEDGHVETVSLLMAIARGNLTAEGLVRVDNRRISGGHDDGTEWSWPNVAPTQSMSIISAA